MIDVTPTMDSVLRMIGVREMRIERWWLCPCGEIHMEQTTWPTT